MCFVGWQGVRCELQQNPCQNVTCANMGVCRATFENYTCECLAGSYSGRHCETSSDRLARLKIVARSLAYVAIIAMITVIMFVLIMDILKYWFGIDATKVETEEIEKELERQRKRKVKKRKASAPVRYVYINSPEDLRQHTGSISTVDEPIA